MTGITLKSTRLHLGSSPQMPTVRQVILRNTTMMSKILIKYFSAAHKYATYLLQWQTGGYGSSSLVLSFTTPNANFYLHCTSLRIMKWFKQSAHTALWKEELRTLCHGRVCSEKTCSALCGQFTQLCCLWENYTMDMNYIHFMKIWGENTMYNFSTRVAQCV